MFRNTPAVSLQKTLLVRLLAFGLLCSSSAFAQNATKGVAVDSRDLTEAEANFLNFGNNSPANLFERIDYPEYSNDIFESIGNDLGTFSSDGRVRLIITVEPNIDRSAGFNALSQNAISRKNEVIQALAGTSALVISDYQGAPVLLIEMDSQSIGELAAIDAIGAVELDRELEAHHGSTIPVINARNLQLHSTTGAGYQGGAGAWGVAVIDNGLRNSHVAFSGKVASEACFVSDNSCPNGTNTMIGAGAAGSCGGAFGRCSHGTHVSGTAVGEFTNSGLLGVDGAAPGARLHAIQVFNASGNGATNSDIFRGLQYVNNLVLQGSQIAAVNMSLGTFFTFNGNCDFFSPAINTISTTLRQNGVLVVASSGNAGASSGMGSPACLSSVVAVGNTLDNDLINSSSNASNELDLYAPGTSVTSSSEASNTSLTTFTGTSMAAPHVAGAAAMLRECYTVGAGAPFADDALLAQLKNTGKPIIDPRTGGNLVVPRINVGAAGRAIRPNDLFASRTSIGNASGSFIGLNTCANHQASEPNHGTSSIASVWFDYQVPLTGRYTFDTCDNVTSFDTTLSVFRGGSIASLTLFAANDDSCGLKSTVAVNATAGESLKIAVSGWGSLNERGNTGVFRLRWNHTPLTCNGLVATIIGTDFADVLQGTNGNDVVVAFGGDDTINGFNGNDTICGGNGNDTILGGNGNDWIDAGDGNDTVKGQMQNDTIFGGNGADTLRGSQGNDTVDGGAGNDDVNGGWGDDFVKGGPDNDIVDGDIGDDVLRGSRGNDVMDGGDGNDNIDGGWGADFIKGGLGNDVLSGDIGDDEIRGSRGADTIDGGDGNDNLNGGWGNDFVKGGPGNDYIDGNIGNDNLRGSRGDDVLIGGAGSDTLNGGVQDTSDSCDVDVADSAPVGCEVVL